MPTPHRDLARETVADLIAAADPYTHPSAVPGPDSVRRALAIELNVTAIDSESGAVTGLYCNTWASRWRATDMAHSIPGSMHATASQIAVWARCHLEPGTVVVSDALGCFGAVRHAGCFHQPFVTGSGPASAQHPALTWVNTILGNIKRSLHGTYHHVSSKHLPRYLGEFSYRFNRRFSLRELFLRFVHVALRTPPMPNRVLELAENYA